jgi:hypothetical protein
VSSIRDAKKIVCVPAFNESKAISNIFQKSKKYANEVIVYDGFKDDTYEGAKSAGATVIRNQEYKVWYFNKVLVPGSKRTRRVYINSLFLGKMKY